MSSIVDQLRIAPISRIWSENWHAVDNNVDVDLESVITLGIVRPVFNEVMTSIFSHISLQSREDVVVMVRNQAKEAEHDQVRVYPVESLSRR